MVMVDGHPSPHMCWCGGVVVEEKAERFALSMVPDLYTQKLHYLKYNVTPGGLNK